AFGNLLDRRVGLLDDIRKLFVAATVEVFLEFAALALEVGIKVGQFALTADTFGFWQYGCVFIKLLDLITQVVGHALQFVVALLEFGLDFGLRSTGRLGVAQNTFGADKTNFGALLLRLNRCGAHGHGAAKAQYYTKGDRAV